jgi:hypothetical protein
MNREQILKDAVRSRGNLAERLEQSRQRIAKMCAERRGPRMTIPVDWSDDDFFICLTIEDAIAALGKAADHG